MSMVFRYLDTPNPDGTLYKRPFILAVFSNGDQKMELYALVDSGADMSAIDYRRAEKLGMDLSSPKVSTYGVAGNIDSVISNVDIEVARGHERYTINVPIRVLYPKSETLSHTIIGRKGFFDRFRITFDEANQKVTMKSNGQD